MSKTRRRRLELRVLNAARATAREIRRSNDGWPSKMPDEKRLVNAVEALDTDKRCNGN